MLLKIKKEEEEEGNDIQNQPQLVTITGRHQELMADRTGLGIASEDSILMMIKVNCEHDWRRFN